MTDNFSPRKILSNLPTPVGTELIDEAYQQLIDYNMMTLNQDEEFTITNLGKFATKIGLQLEYVIMLALGCKLGCASTASVLVAFFLDPPYIKHSYLHENYFEKVREYADARNTICDYSQPIYNLKEYYQNPKKFKYITR